MAQLAEQLICNQQVIGSSPIIGLTLLKRNFNIAGWSSLEARRAHNPKVIDSNPVPATKIVNIFCPDSSVGRAADWKSACHWFDSGSGHFRLFDEDGILAQLVEHLTFNQVVGGSNPPCLIKIEFIVICYGLFFIKQIRHSIFLLNKGRNILCFYFEYWIL